jgi:hypothetical protein
MGRPVKSPGRIERQIGRGRWPSQHKITIFQFPRINLIQSGPDKPSCDLPAQPWASLNPTAHLANGHPSQPLTLGLLIYAESALCTVAQDFTQRSSGWLAALGRRDGHSKALNIGRGENQGKPTAPSHGMGKARQLSPAPRRYRTCGDHSWAQRQAIAPAAQAATWTTTHQQRWQGVSTQGKNKEAKNKNVV